MVKADKILLEFPVLWEGWKHDSKAWVMERPDGTRYLRMTNHGNKYEANLRELQALITEYQRVIDLSKKALSLLAQKGAA